MTYHLVLFEKPESIDYNGPKKWKLSKAKFEKICDPAVVIIQFDDAMYRMDDKKIFSLENYSGESKDSVLVCEAHKLKTL